MERWGLWLWGKPFFEAHDYQLPSNWWFGLGVGFPCTPHKNQRFNSPNHQSKSLLEGDLMLDPFTYILALWLQPELFVVGSVLPAREDAKSPEKFWESVGFQ